jgi:hypothetical protein
VFPKVDYSVRAHKKPANVQAQSRIQGKTSTEAKARKQASQGTAKREARIREKAERRAAKRGAEAQARVRVKAQKKAARVEAKIQQKEAERKAKARERCPARQTPYAGKPGLKRIITDGQLVCLDCGPQPLSEFRVVARKQNGKMYYDSRCHPCRKTRSAARNQNVSPATYREMIGAAGGKCDICGEKTKLVLDHCHETGRLRGALCSPCNQALAPLEKDPDIVMRMAEYLRYWRDLPMTDAEKTEGAERERRRKVMEESSKRMKAQKASRRARSTPTI